MTLPHGIRDVSRDQLLALDARARIDRISGALAAYYLSRTEYGDDPYGDDDGGDGYIDVTHPLILESAVAAEMNVVMQQWLGVTVPIETLLLDGVSIRRLAELLAKDLDGSAPPVDALPALEPDPDGRMLHFALSDIQQAYWIGRDPLYELGAVSASLFVELVVADFDVCRAEAALHAVVERHDMLRSVVDRTGRQRVISVVPPIAIAVADLSEVSPEPRAELLAAERDRMAQRETRPDLWVPLDVRAFHLGSHRTTVMISIDMVKLDAWSAQLLLGEWFQTYSDPTVVVTAPKVTFRDYVRWTEVVRDGAAYQAARRYWLDRLPTLPPSPELPLLVALDTVERPTFRSRSVRIDPARWEALKARAVEHGLTPSMLLCAAYTEVLGTWSRNERFTVSVAGGRPPAHPDIGRVIGPFARPMLVEVDRTGVDLRERSRALQRQFSRDLEHREFSGLDVLREVAARDGRTRATMPVIFTSVLPQDGEGGLPRPEWLLEEPFLVWGMPQLLLENQVLEVDGTLMITWVAVDEVFPAGLVDVMFEAYLALLDGIADDPGTWTCSRPVGLPAAQADVRDRVNDTAALLPDGLLHGLFDLQVGLRPDSPAVISHRRDLTYADLDRQAEHVAAAVVARGVGRDELVGVCMERGWEQVAALLGVLRAGAAYLPLDPDLPEHRLHGLMDQGRVRLVLTQPSVDERMRWPAGVDHETVSHRADEPLRTTRASADPSDLAYVIFTSGSTGRPKGVMIEHRAALNTVLDVNGRFEIGPDDRVFAISSLGFDLSVQDVFGTLSAGGALVMPDPEDALDPAHWSDLVDETGVSVWSSVPALMQLLVDHRRQRVEPGPGLRVVLLSGDWVPVGLPGSVERQWPGSRVVSLGGATEASIWSVFHPVAEGDADRPSIPYGRPLANQRLHVLDRQLLPRPDHVAGDLYIAGAGLARGYWRDPIRTAAAFVEHPGTGERLYRTGDVARYFPGGDLEFLGREDGQVKVNGHRVELGEVEAALSQHPGVRAAVATMHGPRDGVKSLVAFVVTDGPLPTSELRAFAADRLPRHCVPDRVLEISEVPLTPNGKVDRSGLVVPTPQGLAEPSFRQPAAGSSARVLLDALNQLLGVEAGIDDDFFELGGNSLVAVQLAATVQDAGLPLTAALVIRHPSVGALVDLVTAGPDRV